jgi:uncharacterized protein (DUF2345 family)
MAGETRTRQKISETPAGPFEAIVVGHLDPKYMGTLQVELLKTSDVQNDPERSGQMVEVKYLSPFYGVTPQAGTSGNSGYQNTQKSYGMWMIPPDIGTRVLVTFAEGNLSKGYWIGCVQDEYMNFMLPGMAATTQLEDYGKKAPVAEYNKRREKTGQKNPTKFAKPVHIDFTKALIQQGLIDDDVRGISSSSARRETPSAVFGISTPGPLDKRKDAPKFQRGAVGSKATTFVNRLGGSMFVMDDGDDKILRKGHAKDSRPEYVNIEAITDGSAHDGDVTLPANDLLRLKTRTGHQILLHNTEDLIYIGNARGTSWIEMTSNGKIDIYAQDSVSIHSSNDLNFTADRDVNFTAGENVNFMVGKDFKTTAGDSIQNTAGVNVNNTAGQAINEIAGTNISNYANLDASYQSVRNNMLTAGKDLDVTSGGNSNIESGYHTHLISGEAGKIKFGGNLDFRVEGDINLAAGDLYLNNADTYIDGQNFILACNKNFNLEAASTVMNSRVTTEINTDGDFYQIIDGRYGVRADGQIKFQSKSNDIQLRASNDILTWSGSSTNMLVQGNWNVDCNSIAALTSVGSFNISSTNNSNAAIPGGINAVSGAGIEMKTGGGENDGGDFVIDSSWQVKVKTADTFGIDSGNKIQHKAANEIQLKGSKTDLQPSAALPAITANVSAAAPDYVTDIPNNLIANPFISYVKWHKYDLASISVATIAPETSSLPPVFPVTPTPALYADRVARMPMHEPWYQHENLNPLRYAPDKTRAGTEQKDSYHPNIPDTFATTPTAQDQTKVSSSPVFRPEDGQNDILRGTDSSDIGGVTWSNTSLTAWREISQGYGISSEFAAKIFAVIVSQYGSWSNTRAEGKPTLANYDYYDTEEIVNVLRKKYRNFLELSDQRILNIWDLDENKFMENAYGYLTQYGKAIGNKGRTDDWDFRGHGPYLGLVGRGIFEKLKNGVATSTFYNVAVDTMREATGFDREHMFAYWVHKNYRDHGRGPVGNIRIMLFGDEDFYLMHKRDVEVYNSNKFIYSSKAGTVEDDS